MIKTVNVFPALLALILLPLSLCCSAQVVDVSGCRTIEDRLQRFDCYESLEAADIGSGQEAESRERLTVQQRSTDSPAAAAPIEERAQPAAETNSLPVETRDVDSFGKVSATENVRVIEGTDGKSELIDKVASIERLLPNLVLITLQSGQKWRQMVDKRYPVSVGDEVRIYPSRWGDAYRLSATRVSGYIQVERVD